MEKTKITCDCPVLSVYFSLGEGREKLEERTDIRIILCFRGHENVVSWHCWMLLFVLGINNVAVADIVNSTS